MTWRVEWTDEASRALTRIGNREAQLRILNAVNRLAETASGNVRALQGYPGKLRLRVGEYRVIFEKEAERLVIQVLTVGHRREVYRRLG